MSPQIMVPTSQAEAPIGEGNDTPFPKGSWSGTIDEIRTRDLPPWADTPGRGYASEDGVVLSIQFGSNSPLDGQDDIGARKHFVDVVVRDGEETVETIDVTDRDSDSWMLQRGARLLANLGIALGETEELETENGATMTACAEDFRSNLEEGSFDGTNIAFGISHRPWQTKNANGTVLKSGTEVITKEFFQAV